MYPNNHLCHTEYTKLFLHFSFKTEKVNFSAVYCKDTVVSKESILGPYYTYKILWMHMRLFAFFYDIFYLGFLAETIKIKSRLWPSWWLMLYSRLSKWTISSFILINIKCIPLNKTMQSSYKQVFTLAPNVISVTPSVISRGLSIYAKYKSEIPLKFFFFLFQSSQCVHFYRNGISILTVMAIKVSTWDQTSSHP